MRILLIMPRSHKIFTPAEKIPLGIAYIASTLEKEGHAVKCADMSLDSTIPIERYMEEAELIGISCNTPNVKEGWRLAEIAKEKGKTVIFGGPHPTALPEETLQNGADIIVRGEGEITMKEICEGKKLENILGISFKHNGHIIHNQNRPFIQDLDSLPFPARHLFNYRKYRVNLHRHSYSEELMTSRGCPFGCNFCQKVIFGRNWRFRSPKNVVEEWKLLLNEFGYEELGMADDNFTADPNRAKKICQMIIDQNSITDWTTLNGIRVDTASKDLFEIMKKSGCYRVAFGVEAGSQDMLEKINKKITLEQVRNAVKLAKETGFETVLFFMVGNLYETEKTVQKTIDFAKELDPDYAQFNIAAPYPATELYEVIKKEGKFLITDWDAYGSFETRNYFEHGQIKGDFAARMQKKAYRTFYFRPKIILRTLRRDGTDSIKNFFARRKQWM
jgi:radical SAM superfamily enzyme YgiQ (UPF0313 family)